MITASNALRATLALTGLVLLGGCDSDAPAVDNAAAPANEAVALQQGNDFPSGFDGRWGVLDSDCTSPVRGASEMYVVIKGDTLTFHDRVGKVTEMTAKSAEKVTTRIDFSGRGQEWFRRTNWFLEDDGKSLIRADLNPVVNMTYSRCD